jgi:hypothetical protein
MKETPLILFLLASPLVAQAPPPTSESVVTVGCVNRAIENGSLAGSPGVSPATPSTAPALANKQEPTGALLLNGAQQVSSEASGSTPVTYVLDGKTQELERHLGHQVQVTGTLRTVHEGASGAKTPVQHIQVTALKMLGQCPTPDARK